MYASTPSLPDADSCWLPLAWRGRCAVRRAGGVAVSATIATALVVVAALRGSAAPATLSLVRLRLKRAATTTIGGTAASPAVRRLTGGGGQKTGLVCPVRPWYVRGWTKGAAGEVRGCRGDQARSNGVQMTIRDVLDKLTEQQRERVARRRAERKRRTTVQAPTVDGLAASYKEDWSELLRDMTKAELTRALTVLDTNELRVIVLRAFDGRQVALSSQLQTPEGIIEKLCHAAPRQLRERTWRDVYAKMLQDVGWKTDRVPAGLRDSVRLQRIFE